MKQAVFSIAGAFLVCGAIFAQATSDKQAGDKKADVQVGDKKTEAPIPESPYYPLKVGTTWEYLSGGKKIVVKVAAHETLDGITSARLETEVSGGKVTENIAVKPDGVYRVRSNSQEIKPPLLLLKLPSKGESWSVDCAVKDFGIKGKFTAGEDKLTVGKNQYETVSVKSSDLLLAGQSVSMETWYAKGVGMVKQHLKLAAAELDIVLELENYTEVK